MYPTPIRFASRLVLKFMAPPIFVVDHVRTAKCPELLCPSRALLMMGWCPAPPRRALPLLHRSYELMRQTSSLLWRMSVALQLNRLIVASRTKRETRKVTAQLAKTGLSPTAWRPSGAPYFIEIFALRISILPRIARHASIGNLDNADVPARERCVQWRRELSVRCSR